MNGPGLPVSCAIELQRSYCCEGIYPEGLAANERGKSFKEHEDLLPAKVHCCQHQGKVSQESKDWVGMDKETGPTRQ